MSSLNARYFSVLTNVSNYLLSKDYNPPFTYEQVKALKLKDLPEIIKQDLYPTLSLS